MSNPGQEVPVCQSVLCNPNNNPNPIAIKSMHGGPLEEAEYIFPIENITSEDSSYTR